MAKLPSLHVVLSAALKGALAYADAHPAIKGISNFWAEVLPHLHLSADDKQVLQSVTEEEFREAWPQVDLASKNAALAAAGVERVEDFAHQFRDALQETLGRMEGMLKEILKKMEQGNTQRGLDQDEEIQRLRAALARAERAADGGDAEAQAALLAARRSGDVEKLQTVLMHQADRREEEFKARAADYFDLCREIATVAFLRGDIDEARDRLNAILKMFPDDRDALNRLGHIHRLRGRLDESERAYQRVLQLSSDSLTWRAVAYGNLGIVYQIRGDLNRAEEMHRKSLAIEKELGHREGMAAAYGSLGNVYRIRGDLDLAEEMHREALEIYEAFGRCEGMARAYGSLGIVYQTRGNLDRAEEMYGKAVEIDEELGHREGMATAYGNLGFLYKTRGALDRAEEMYRKSLAIEKALGRREGMASDYCNLGIVYKIRGDLDRAESFWTKARDLFSEIGMPHMVKKVQGLLDGLAAGKVEK